MNLRRILAPTDFSPPSAFALDEALRLASAFHASVTVLHAHSLKDADERSGGATSVARRLDRLVADAALHSGRPVEARSVLGAPTPSILAEAARGAYDLIVMSGHGRSGLPRLQLGSVAEAVIRAAPCPVWAVPARLLDTHLFANP